MDGMLFDRLGCRKNSELFTLTYGALVRHLLLDLESPEEVNKQLDRMGQNIGVRLVDDFLAKTNTTRCRNFKEAAKTIADAGFKMFLGIDAKVTQIDDKECKMVGLSLPAASVGSLSHLSSSSPRAWVQALGFCEAWILTRATLTCPSFFPFCRF